MPSTTSLKLPDALKATIAKVAAFEGKTSHALMVDTLQTAMEDALVRQQFYADGEASYQDTLRSNTVFSGADVKAYALARVAGGAPIRPKAVALDATKPMNPTHD
jgi:predicted transcriptional regulator